MLFSKLFGKTLKEKPSDTEVSSHALMERAGLISQVVSGVYSYLPMAWNSLRRIESIIREEMNTIGSQELHLPVLQPAELWDSTGRKDLFGQNLFTLEDRRNRTLVLAPTHEEVLTSLVAANVQSYKDLPFILYQIQTKFRDEERPRGGLLRCREFHMKDAYSFSSNSDQLDIAYEDMIQAYHNIFDRCGLSTVMVEADSGAIGGKDSHEFIALSNIGEDTIAICTSCKYGANVERAEFVKPVNSGNSDNATPEEVHTPAITDINALSSFLNVSKSDLLKSMFYLADGKLLVVVLEGNYEVNEIKLRNTLNIKDLAIASDSLIRSAGFIPGFASPVGDHKDVTVVVDDSVIENKNYVVGANKVDYHLKNVQYGRDFKKTTVSIEIGSDLALVKDGDLCLHCNSKLKIEKGIEIGHVFKLGTTYSEKLNAYFVGADGVRQPIIMGCYGIGVGRILSASIEQNHDPNGIIFPKLIAPYDVSLLGLNVEQEDVKNEADSLYESLTSNGANVLYDDRIESPGVKFNDADLIGLPIRLVVSARNIAQGVIEVKKRSDSDAIKISKDEVVKYVTDLL